MLFQQVEEIFKEFKVAEEGLKIQWGRPQVGSVLTRGRADTVVGRLGNVPQPPGRCTTPYPTRCGLGLQRVVSGRRRGELQTSSKAWVSRMPSQSCSRKLSATCAQVGVSRLYSIRVNRRATAKMTNAIIRRADTTRTPSG